MPSKRILVAELRELAAAGARLRLRFGAGQLDRLTGLLAEPENGDEPASVAADVEFGTGADGLPRVAISVTGRLSVRCQRCLGPLEWPLALTVSLAVLERDEQAEQLEDPFDSIVIGAEGLALQAVIEDEILAALPLAPCHEPERCAGAGLPLGELNSDIETGQTHRPFAGLATLIADRQRDDG
jgi:uncharacterized protein